MRIRTVSSIILPSAHKVKASARNSVTTVVGGGRERCSGGLLKESPEPPQNFSRIFYWRGWSGGAERGLAPGGGRAPARHLFALPLWCLVGGRGGFGRPPALPLAFFPAPIPPPALAERSSRREGGEYYFISPGATAPGTPGIKPFAALTEPAKRVPAGGACPRRCRFGGRWRHPAGGLGGFGRRLTLPLWCPVGGLAFFVARLPCL